jgi:hypothetical protein
MLIFLLDKLKKLFENFSDIAGEMECSLGEIMAQQSRGFTRPLKGKTGTIRFDSVIVCQECRIRIGSGSDPKDYFADLGCLSRIRIFPSRILDPGSKVTGSRIRIRNTKLTTFGWKYVHPGSESATLLLNRIRTS